MSSEPILTQHKVTVLLIDDQPMIGEAVRRMLAGEPDIVFHYCRDAARALEEAHRVQPTVILQDLVMPEIDGLTLVKTFRGHEPTRETPMIVLSTKEEPTVKAEAFALYQWFLPLLRMDTVVKFVQLIKLVQQRVGVGSDRVRPPRLPLQGDELREANAVIDRALATRPQLKAEVSH